MAYHTTRLDIQQKSHHNHLNYQYLFELLVVHHLLPRFESIQPMLQSCQLDKKHLLVRFQTMYHLFHFGSNEQYNSYFLKIHPHKQHDLQKKLYLHHHPMDMRNKQLRYYQLNHYLSVLHQYCLNLYLLVKNYQHKLKVKTS